MKKILIAAVFIVFSFRVFAAAGDYIKYGNYYYKKGQYKKAVKYYSAVLKKNPRNVPVMKYCAFAYMKAGYKERAAEYFERLYKLTQNKTYLLYARKMRSTGQRKSGAAGDYVWKGGTARVYGMGKTDIALPDASNANDLYEAGVTAALASRPKQNVIYAGPGLYNLGMSSSGEEEILGYTYKTENKFSSTGFGLNPAGKAGISSVFWINNDIAVGLKPLVLTEPVTLETTTSSSLGTDTDTSKYSMSALKGEAEITYRINKDISAGLMLGYDSGNIKAEEGSGPDTTVSKLEYFLTGAYKTSFMKHDITLALGGGSGSRKDTFSFMGPDEMFGGSGIVFNDSLLLEGYSMHSEYTMMDTETKEDISMGGFDIIAGAGVKSDKTEAAVRAGVAMGRAGTRQRDVYDENGDKIDIASVDKYDAYKNGGGISLSSRARRYIGPVIIGFKMDYSDKSMDYFSSEDDEEAEKISSNVFNVTAGAALTTIKNFIIPVEFFIKNKGRSSAEEDTGSKHETSYWGLRAGGEYKLNKAIAVRAGLDYSAGGTAEETWAGDDVTVSEYGTKENPGYSIIGISAGGGYDFGAGNIDIALRYENTSQSPLGENVNEYSQGEIYFLTGLFIYL